MDRQLIQLDELISHQHSSHQFFFVASCPVTLVNDQARFIEISDRGEFDAAGSVQAVHHAAHSVRLHNASLGHRELVGFQHADVAKRLLHAVTKPQKIDANGEAHHHDRFKELQIKLFSCAALPMPGVAGRREATETRRDIEPNEGCRSHAKKDSSGFQHVPRQSCVMCRL